MREIPRFFKDLFEQKTDKKQRALSKALSQYFQSAQIVTNRFGHPLDPDPNPVTDEQVVEDGAFIRQRVQDFVKTIIENLGIEVVPSIGIRVGAPLLSPDDKQKFLKYWDYGTYLILPEVELIIAPEKRSGSEYTVNYSLTEDAPINDWATIEVLNHGKFADEIIYHLPNKYRKPLNRQLKSFQAGIILGSINKSR